MTKRVRQIDAYKEMIRAWEKYEKASEAVSMLEQFAEEYVAKHGKGDNTDYEIDTVLSQHAYKHRVAIRNSARDKIHAYSALLQGMAANKQIRESMEMVAEVDEVDYLGVPRQR